MRPAKLTVGSRFVAIVTGLAVWIPEQGRFLGGKALFICSSSRNQFEPPQNLNSMSSMILTLGLIRPNKRF